MQLPRRQPLPMLQRKLVATSRKDCPTLLEEMALFEQGYCFVAGLDEAGRGCLAGPVVAAAVLLPLHEPPGDILERFAGVNDSKQLTAPMRARLYDTIMREAVAVGVGIGSVTLIDERNILQATKWAMCTALQELSPQPQALLLDALLLSNITLPQRSIIKGDARCLSIAAASIVAKVTRDRLMRQLHDAYPAYGFAQHKGYGSAAHLAALQKYGVTPHHRRSFKPVREMLFGLFSDAAEKDS